MTHPAIAGIPESDRAYLSTAEPREDVSAVSPPSILRPIFGIFLLGGLCVLALYLSKRRQRKEQVSELIQILAAAPIAQGVIVQIIDACGAVFVVAISRNGPTVIGQIHDAEKISEIRARVSQEAMNLAIPPIPFQKTLEKLFRRRTADTTPPGVPPGDPAPVVREKLLREAIDRVRRLNPTEKD